MSEFAKTSDRPIGVGTTWHGVGSFMGRKTESGAEYSQLEADRVFTLQATTPFPTSMAFASELVASGTRVDLTVEAEPTGLYRLAEPLLSTGWPGRFSSAVRAAVPERPRQAQGPDGHPRPLVGAPTAARR